MGKVRKWVSALLFGAVLALGVLSASPVRADTAPTAVTVTGLDPTAVTQQVSASVAPWILIGGISVVIIAFVSRLIKGMGRSGSRSAS